MNTRTLIARVAAYCVIDDAMLTEALVSSHIDLTGPTDLELRLMSRCAVLAEAERLRQAIAMPALYHLLAGAFFALRLTVEARAVEAHAVWAQLRLALAAHLRSGAGPRAYAGYQERLREADTILNDLLCQGTDAPGGAP